MDEVRQIDGVPEQLGDYLLLGRIGEGGMGTVYEAVQGRLNRRVALKVLAPRLARDELFLSRFQREARAAAAINHPNLIQVHDIGEEGGVHFYVMEFVEGENVGQRIKREGALPLEEALSIGVAVTEALAEVHERSIVHRDIKPENIMVDIRGHVRLADLGLAKCLAGDTAMTLTGAGMGSPHYMAPEQAKDAGSVDRRADIYSLGITLLTMLTGRRPFNATSPYLLLQAHAEKPLPPGADLGRPLAPDLEALIARMSAKEPDARFQDCAAVREALVRVLGDRSVMVRPAKDGSAGRELARQMAASGGQITSVSTIGSVTGEAAAATRGRSRAVWIGASVLAALFAIAGAFVAGGSGGGEDEAEPSVEADDSGSAAHLTEDDLMAMLVGPEPPRLVDGLPGRIPGLPPSVRGLLVPGRELNQVIYRLPMGAPVVIRKLNLFAGRSPDEIWADAETFARDRPSDHRGILVRYLSVYHSSQTAAIRKQAVLRLEQHATSFERLCLREIEAFTLEMKLRLEEGDPAAAYDVWRGFTRPLLIFKHEPMIHDIIRTNIPPEHLPADFGVIERVEVPGRVRVPPRPSQ